jgi:DNA-binding LacI/PurR family transcriptional regulator
VNRLVEAGHRTFGLVSGPEDSVVSAERMQGATSRLAELGVTKVTVVPGDYSYDAGAAGLKALQRRLGRLPDAVICANDIMALGCMDAARFQLRLKVPADLSIAGFDGVGPARWQSYDLTTVQQPVRRMADAAVAMIVERIENPKLPPEKRTFSGIVLEGSSARLRRS